MKLPMSLINVRLPKALLDQIDELANTTFMSRTEMIREAIVDRLRAQPGSSLPRTEPYNLTLLTVHQLDELSECVRWEKRRRSQRRQAQH